MSEDLEKLTPGAIVPGGSEVLINPGLTATSLTVTNTGPVPIQLTAYFHVFEANPRLRFDRRRAFGMRPDVPSGGAIRFEAGETRRIELVPIGGRRVVYGFNGLVDGPLDEADVDVLLQRAIERGFLHQTEGERKSEES